MVTIDRVKEIVIAATISLPIFFFGGKVLKAVREEIFPSDDDDDFLFDED